MKPRNALPRELAPLASPLAILQALPQAVLTLRRDLSIDWVNAAAEALLQRSALLLAGKSLGDLLGPAHPLVELAEAASRSQVPTSKYEVELVLARSSDVRRVDAVATPLEGEAALVLLTLVERSSADLLERQLAHRTAARSVGGMAAVLAHEIKNPLSGIRGAAQLLEAGADEDGLELTRLICSETDRIAGLIDRMEVFGSRPASRPQPVNIHAVLDHVRRLAASGFASHIRFVEDYDPSLPPVPGDRDRLVQAVLNLVKNAADAIGERRRDGVIALRTAFRPGLRLAGRAGGGRLGVPLLVTIEDNGPGVPEPLRAHLFEAFVTSKPGGTGLGLALVAKIAEEHGGFVDLEQQGGRTRFRLALPVMKETGA